MGDVTMPLDRAQAIVEHLVMDGSREGLILGDELNVAMGASARRRAARAAEPTDLRHPIIRRVTHVGCGAIFTDSFTLDVLNEVDVQCPQCSSYGVMVWEHRDGTLWETESNGDEVTRHQPVRTHVQVYKSWTNAPDTGEWWIVPRPNTGDIDGSDNLIVGFDTYQQALDAVTSGGLRTTFAELCTDKDGIAWRDRHNPIYQTTPPKGA